MEVEFESTEECIGAVLDLIDVHLHDGAAHRGRVGASRSSRTTSGSDPGGRHEERSLVGFARCLSQALEIAAG
jgi:hypothetical protein